jgi:hypothetical protein
MNKIFLLYLIRQNKWNKIVYQKLIFNYSINIDDHKSLHLAKIDHFKLNNKNILYL